MKGNELPGDDHVIRYAKPTCIAEVDGVPTVQGPAFYSRPIDDHGASYNWLEYFEGDEGARLTEVRSRARLKLGATALLAKLNIGMVRKALETEFADQNIKIVEDPLEATDQFPADPSHTLMINMPAAGEPLVEAIGDLLAEMVIDTFPARQPVSDT